MKLISLDCYKCGANLEIEESLKEATCKFCGSVNYLDDYKLDENYKRELSLAKNVLNNIREYNDAIHCFEVLIESYPNSAECRYLLIEAFTHHYKYFSMPDDYIDKMDTYFECYKAKEMNEDRFKINAFKILSFKIKLLFNRMNRSNGEETLNELLLIIKSIDELGISFGEVEKYDREYFGYINRISKLKKTPKFIRKYNFLIKLFLILIGVLCIVGTYIYIRSTL